MSQQNQIIITPAKPVAQVNEVDDSDSEDLFETLLSDDDDDDAKLLKKANENFKVVMHNAKAKAAAEAKAKQEAEDAKDPQEQMEKAKLNKKSYESFVPVDEFDFKYPDSDNTQACVDTTGACEDTTKNDAAIALEIQQALVDAAAEAKAKQEAEDARIADELAKQWGTPQNYQLQRLRFRE